MVKKIKINLGPAGLIALITLLGTGCQKESGITPKEEHMIENAASNLDRIRFTNDILLAQLFLKHKVALRLHNGNWSSSQTRDNFKNLIRAHVNNHRTELLRGSYRNTRNANYHYGVITPYVWNMAVITDMSRNIIGMERLSPTEYTALKSPRRASTPN